MQKLTFRRANQQDLDLIYDIVLTVVDSLQEPDYYAADDKESMGNMIEEKGFTLLAEYNKVVAGFISVLFPKEEKGNLGNDIGLSNEELHKVVHIEAVAVLPQFRGKGLQIKLMKEAEKLLQSMDYTYYMATVYPKNSYSLNNFLALDYKIIKTMLKYGGLERHILMKEIKHTI